MSLALALVTAEAAVVADPLRRYRHAGDAHRRAVAYTAAGLEVALRGANQSAKTYTAAAWVVACTRGLASLDGTPLPRCRVPCVFGVCVPDHGQQVDSSQAAIFHWLGRWPHHVGWLRKDLHQAGVIYVRPDGWTDDAHESWSRIVFVSHENADKVLGQRWDGGLGDEPPHPDIWREMRKNTRTRMIAFTPLERPQWEWIQRDFAGTLDSPNAGRVELVATLYDNLLLPDRERRVRELEAAYRNDPFRRARLYGEYVDVSGETPFGPVGYQRLQRMRSQSRQGEALRFIRRDRATQKRMSYREAGWECWEAPEQGAGYVLTCDPSLGVSGRDRAAAWVVREQPARLVARFFGHMPVYELGRSIARVGRWYGNAMLAPETNGVGAGLLRDIKDYPRLWRERVLDRASGSYSERIGWTTTEASKAVGLTALQDAVIEGWLEIPSGEALDSLLALRLDGEKSGRLIREPGQNHEDMTCGLIACHILRSVRKRDPGTMPPLKRERVIRRALGLDTPRWTPPDTMP